MINIQSIKESLNILEVAAPYCEGLIKTGSCYQARVNPLRQEKTSSLYLYADSQTYHDFGSGEHGDVIDFYMKVTGLSFKEALKQLSQMAGMQSTPTHDKQHIKRTEQPKAKPSPDFSTLFNQFEPVSYATHQAELEKLFPKWLMQETNQANMGLLLSRLRFDKANQTLVYAIKSQQGQITGIKRHRLEMAGNLKKWVACKNSEVNHCMTRIQRSDPPIFILEGIKDGLNALLLGLDFIALPSAQYKAFNLKELELLENRDIIFIADTDKAGIECMQRLSAQVEDSANSLFILDLRQFFIALHGDDIAFKSDEKIDFADAVRLHADKGGQPLGGSYSECFKAQLLLYINSIRDGVLP